MYEHDQIWADPKSIDGAQWSRMETGCPRKWAAWKKDDPLLVDQNSAWCPTLSTGSINYAVRCDYPYFAEHPEGDFPKSLAFLAPYRSRSARGDKVNKPKQAPSVQDRINIEGDWKDGLRDAKRQRVDSEREEGEFKRHRRGPLDRRKGVYGKKKKGEVKANWRKYANELVNNLDAHGIRYIFAEKHWEQSFKNMGLP